MRRVIQTKSLVHHLTHGDDLAAASVIVADDVESGGQDHADRPTNSALCHLCYDRDCRRSRDLGQSAHGREPSVHRAARIFYPSSAAIKSCGRAPGSSASNAQTSGVSAPASGITVARWEFSPTVSGRPVYLSMTLDGTQEAIDRMQAGPPLTIRVHSMHDNAGAASGAPNLVTDLTIGWPGLATTLDGDVRRKGYFEWHTWTRKDYLSPGAWTVSVTYPDRQPLACGPDAQPCTFTINVG